MFGVFEIMYRPFRSELRTTWWRAAKRFLCSRSNRMLPSCHIPLDKAIGWFTNEELIGGWATHLKHSHWGSSSQIWLEKSQTLEATNRWRIYWRDVKKLVEGFLPHPRSGENATVISRVWQIVNMLHFRDNPQHRCIPFIVPTENKGWKRIGASPPWE